MQQAPGHRGVLDLRGLPHFSNFAPPPGSANFEQFCSDHGAKTFLRKQPIFNAGISQEENTLHGERREEWCGIYRCTTS